MVRRAQRDERTELRGRELIFRAPDCSELVQPSRALNQLFVEWGLRLGLRVS